MTRTKWKKEEFIDDDIVIAVDGDEPRRRWLLGRVTFNRVCVTTVKTAGVEITRLVTKLCLLENE